MKTNMEKPVAELTTDEIGHAYVDRLLSEGTTALEADQSTVADGDFFAGLRQYVQMIAAHTS